MKAYPQVDRLLDQSEKMQCCAHSTNSLIQKGLYRRYLAGDLAKPYPGLYSRHEYWNRLNGAEQSLHMARTLKGMHPDWVFAGLTAAAAYGFEHQWFLHHEITITLSTHGSYRPHDKLHVIYSPYPKHDATIASGIPVTNKARTLVDCGNTQEFRGALPVFDSAAAGGLDEAALMKECSLITQDCSKIIKLLRYTNTASDNGGESFARGTMIEAGFAEPRLQVVIVDPATGQQYRVDFLWRTDDGRIIVCEFDGTAKYVDPEMTSNRSIQETVQLERNREQGLRRAGVTDIIRLTFNDVLQIKPMVAKLRRSGVPMAS